MAEPDARTAGYRPRALKHKPTTIRLSTDGRA